MNDRDRKNPLSSATAGLTRRHLLRGAGMLGVGALGVSVLGCKGRPEQDFIDLSTDPTLLQAGGTISGTVRGLLTGAVAEGVRVRLVGFGVATTERDGSFAIRVTDPGDYDIEINGEGFHPRTSRLRVTGSGVVNVELLERGAGLALDFLDQFARGRGPGGKAGVEPRTPGRTNRWTRPPSVVIYRQLEDDDRDVIPAARLAAMQASIQSLFGPLTGNALGFAPVEVRSGKPPRRIDRAQVGTIVIGQRKDRLLSAETVGATSDTFEIVKARVSNGVDSPIEVFNRMFAHALGAQVVSGAFDSIVNAGGRATLSEVDRQAATFLYSRAPGNRAPDADPPGVLLNG